MDESKVEGAGPEVDASAPVDPKKPPLDFMDLADWPIPVCVAWIAWRDHARASMAYSEWRKRAREMLPSRSFRDLHQDCIEGLFNVATRPTPIPEAAQLMRDLQNSWERGLKKALREGMILARGKLYNNQNDEISIKPEEWRSIDNIDDYLFTNKEGEYVFGVLSTENSRANGYRDRPIYISVTLPRDEVLALWPPAASADTPSGVLHEAPMPSPPADGQQLRKMHGAGSAELAAGGAEPPQDDAHKEKQVNAPIHIPHARPGRKIEYPWPKFYDELRRFCSENGGVLRPKILEHMIDWCGDNFEKEPSQSVIQAHIKRALNGDDAPRPDL